jgi:UDP-glucose 4-epimerase
MKNVLITGGAGFIGSNLAKYLLIKGYNIFIIDDLSTGSIDNIPKEAFFFKGKTEDKKILKELNNKNIDLIFHLSGQSSGEISFDDPQKDLSDNVSSTLALCDFMIKNNIKDIFYASSVCVYGDPSNFPSKESDMVAENIKGFYGIGKLASENYLRLYHKNYNLNATCLRFYTIYGPGQNMSNLRQGMVSIFMELIMSKQDPVIVKGSLDRFRDLLHIDDLLEMLFRLIKKDLTGYNIFNLGTGHKTTVNEIIQIICKTLEVSPKIISEGTTSGDFFGAQADINLIADLIDYTPQITAQEGIESYVKWYRRIREN